MAQASHNDEDESDTGLTVAGPYRWEAEPIARGIQDILDAMEVPEIDDGARIVLQKAFFRRNLFNEDGRGHVVLVLRCICESTGNEAALIEPVVDAVSSCIRSEFTKHGVKLIEAFDNLPLLEILQTMRSLNLFKETSLGHYLGIILHNKLAAALNPPQPEPVKQPTSKELRESARQAQAAARVVIVENNIVLGLQLMKLKSETRRNITFGALRRKHFGDVDPQLAMEAARVARAYCQRPDIYRRLGWPALVELSSPSLTAGKRKQLEARILAGEKVTRKEIAAARGQLPNGRPKWAREKARVAA
jgi:hypothetical protein